MKIVELKQVPIEEDDPRGWWVRNRDSLRRLRRFARECGATVYGDDMPATTMERYRLELEARGQTPTPSEVFALGGSIDALRSPALAAVAAHGWYLFRHRPRGLVARALEHVTPVRLAMAIRAWDPEPLQPASTELELRGYRRRLREMDKRLRHLRAASVDEPAEVISFGASCAIERTPQGMIEEAIRVLARQRASFAEWIEYRARLALSTMLAEAAILGASPRDRLPPMIEHQIADARRRWWAPVSTTLRACGWHDSELAALLLDEQWFLDLVPYTRLHYDGDPRHPALVDQLRNARRAERRHVSRTRRAARQKTFP